MEEQGNKKRYITLSVILLLFAALCITRLVILQLVNGEEYYQKSLSRTQRTTTIEAARGEIYDRYGRVIVSNRMGFSIEFQRVKGMKDDEINGIIIGINNVLKKNGDESVSDELPITKDAPYKFTFDDTSGKALKEWKKQMSIPLGYSATDVINYYCKQFNIDSTYTKQDKRIAAGVRYSMLLRGFSTNTSYILAEDVSKDSVVSIKESYDEYRGINIITKSVRDYPYGSMAAHILGRTGLINEEEYSSLKGKGYKLKDQVGKQGLEKYLENDLRGKSGKAVVEQDENGHFVTYTPVEKSVSGDSAYLTIDLDVQQVAEKALSDTVKNIYENSAASKGSGRDVSGAAAVAVDVNTGEIICMASYPTYQITDFNKEYNNLISNSKKPLFNRAIAGVYSPGSTFKMAVGIAALESGTIRPTDTIYDKVIFTLGSSHFKCLKNHGYVDVSKAIGVSCNYYFYTVGHEMGIETIKDYAERFGFGKHTGIELESEEAVGTVACPETKSARGEPWYEGYTVQAAIGQDDNNVTPLQLASYVSQIATGGTRYTPHLVKSICTYEDKKMISETKSAVEESFKIKPENIKAVQQGMRMAATEGTGSYYFKDYNIEVAAKTGTAQVNGGSDNSLFVAYAPFNNPQIAVAVVIERGGNGFNGGPVAKAIIDAYLNAANEKDSDGAIDKLY
ncbi:MAG: penicillin-binding transpeptidase domain-containing protein [Bacillota bacterium]|nr:penicillin-binding transpeptidase domain-containing protein [Bacillota bacterium]